MSNRQSDINRINFIIDRDAPEKVIAFAKQARSQYRRASLSSKRKYGKGGVYRFKFIDSYLFHKKFVEMNNLNC